MRKTYPVSPRPLTLYRELGHLQMHLLRTACALLSFFDFRVMQPEVEMLWAPEWKLAVQIVFVLADREAKAWMVGLQK